MTDPAAADRSWRLWGADGQTHEGGRPGGCPRHDPTPGRRRSRPGRGTSGGVGSLTLTRPGPRAAHGVGPPGEAPAPERDMRLNCPFGRIALRLRRTGPDPRSDVDPAGRAGRRENQ